MYYICKIRYKNHRCNRSAKSWERTRNSQKTIVIWILIGWQLSGDKVTSGEKVTRKSERKGVTQPYIWHMAPNNLIICTSDKLLLSITSHQWSQPNLLKSKVYYLTVGLISLNLVIQEIAISWIKMGTFMDYMISLKLNLNS